MRLLELRAEKGLSQREVAKLLQISQGTYNNWENGRTQPSIEQLITLAKLFSVSVDYLVENTDEFGTVDAGNGLSEKERRLLKCYRSLSTEAQAGLLCFFENKE